MESVGDPEGQEVRGDAGYVLGNPRLEGGVGFVRVILFNQPLDRQVCIDDDGTAHAHPAVADAKFAAFVATRADGPLGVTMIPSSPADSLAPHSLNLLPLSSEVKAGLRRLPHPHHGDAAYMEQAPFADQFGPAGGRTWAFSRGINDSPMIPREHVDPIVEDTVLPSPFASGSNPGEPGLRTGRCAPWQQVAAGSAYRRPLDLDPYGGMPEPLPRTYHWETGENRAQVSLSRDEKAHSWYQQRA